jgi:hypothetical protein
MGSEPTRQHFDRAVGHNMDCTLERLEELRPLIFFACTGCKAVYAGPSFTKTGRWKADKPNVSNPPRELPTNARQALNKACGVLKEAHSSLEKVASFLLKEWPHETVMALGEAQENLNKLSRAVAQWQALQPNEKEKRVSISKMISAKELIELERKNVTKLMSGVRLRVEDAETCFKKNDAASPLKPLQIAKDQLERSQDELGKAIRALDFIIFGTERVLMRNKGEDDEQEG